VKVSDVRLAARWLRQCRAHQALHHAGHGHRSGKSSQHQRPGRSG
jgi:hypothetical protein